MRVVSTVVAALFMGLVGIKAASAQQHPMPANSYAVGHCDDHLIQTRSIIGEAVVQLPGSWHKRAFVSVPNNPTGPAQIIDAVPDPSGIHLLAVRSGVAGVNFWITRSGQLIAINNAGQVQPRGNCVFAPQFAAQFPLPQPMNVAPPTSLALGFDGAAAGETAPNSSIPENLFGEGVYVANPLLVKTDTAAQCLAASGGNEARFFDCTLKGSLGSREKAAYECATSSRTRNETALCLFAQNLGGNEQAQLENVRQCYAQHGTTWDAYPVCLAEAAVDPNVMNLVECARKNVGSGQDINYWSLGACALGPKLLGSLNPNAEASIAIDCAMKTGGNPKAFAVCTGGQLTVNELNKCLTHGIGDKGCFGKGNTLVKAFDEIDQGLATAFGDQSVAYDAWKVARVTMDPSAMANAMKHYSAEAGKILASANATTAKALEDVGKAAAKVVPQVKIGKPKGKIFGKKWSL